MFVNNVNRIFVVSENADDVLLHNLKKHGKVLILKRHSSLLPSESAHVDMQLNRITDKLCVYASGLDNNIIDCLESEGIELIAGSVVLKEKYPFNIAYNVLHSDKIYFHNVKFTDPVLKALLDERKMKSINVKQGYAGCSGIFVNDILITSDKGIATAAEMNNIEYIYFNNPQCILLEGFDHGFIGGCCGYDKELGLLINCNENNMPECLKFDLKTKDISYLCVGKSVLTDIGGIAVFTGQK